MDRFPDFLGMFSWKREDGVWSRVNRNDSDFVPEVCARSAKGNISLAYGRLPLAFSGDGYGPSTTHNSYTQHHIGLPFLRSVRSTGGSRLPVRAG